VRWRPGRLKTSRPRQVKTIIFDKVYKTKTFRIMVDKDLFIGYFLFCCPHPDLKERGNSLETVTKKGFLDSLSCPDDMWELRAELPGDSPHLSKEVLMTAADKTDVLPESILFEILSANPDELRDKELMDYLENKGQPLPSYMISIHHQVSGNTSYKTILLDEMAGYYAAKSRAAQNMIRSIVNDTVFDADGYRNWLDNLGGINTDRQIIASYIQEGDQVHG
jgi:hypothetical protein